MSSKKSKKVGRGRPPFFISSTAKARPAAASTLGGQLSSEPSSFLSPPSHPTLRPLSFFTIFLPLLFPGGTEKRQGEERRPGSLLQPHKRTEAREKKVWAPPPSLPFSLHYCFLLHGTVILPSKLKSARSQHIRRTELGLSSSTHTAPVLINGWLGKSILGCRSSLLSFLSKELRYPFPFPISRDTTFWAIYRKSAAAKDKNGTTPVLRLQKGSFLSIRARDDRSTDDSEIAWAGFCTLPHVIVFCILSRIFFFQKQKLFYCIVFELAASFGSCLVESFTRGPEVRCSGKRGGRGGGGGGRGGGGEESGD